MVRFFVNQEEVELRDFPPDLTVLDYLRNEKGLCGTKEGCASGDCGACTVVIAEPEGEGLSYRSINSCITFAGALHGRQLLVVEHLAEKNTLHPVQQALIDHHGSQCGFCTPGFVMSLFALYKNTQGDVCDKRTIESYLGGNLCRCTGYRPIVDAAFAATRRVQADKFSADEKNQCQKLLSLNTKPQQPGPVNFHIPQSIAELNTCLANTDNARLVAGSTDLALEVTQQLRHIPVMIQLDRVHELHRVVHHEQHLELGAALSLTSCKGLIGGYYPQTAELFDRFGSTQIRNQGTIGGNIANASPIGDLPPVLIALEAGLRLQKGEVIREIPLEDFFIDYRKTALQPGEFIRSVLLPLPRLNQRFRVYKVSKRLDDDISAVCMAIALTISSDRSAVVETVRIALGGMAAIPKRAVRSESVLANRNFDEQTIALAQQTIAQDFEPISDARATAEYRIQVAQNLLYRFFVETTRPGISVRIGHAA